MIRSILPCFHEKSESVEPEACQKEASSREEFLVARNRILECMTTSQFQKLDLFKDELVSYLVKLELQKCQRVCQRRAIRGESPNHQRHLSSKVTEQAVWINDNQRKAEMGSRRRKLKECLRIGAAKEHLLGKNLEQRLQESHSLYPPVISRYYSTTQKEHYFYEMGSIGNSQLVKCKIEFSHLQFTSGALSNTSSSGDNSW
jgi:hypothetical protein